MTIYRLSIEQYKDDLSGTGAKLFGGRWNNTGIPALYATENISLAVLEILVRTSVNFIPLHYYLLKLDLPAESITALNKNKLKKDWKADVGYTQFIGSEFIRSNKALVMKLPSAIVDEEHNFIINTVHPGFKKIKITSSKKFSFDKRLYLKNE
ncbi:MAG: RES family NAD+ phosphorylase [Ferruginibacter sp.]